MEAQTQTPVIAADGELAEPRFETAALTTLFQPVADFSSQGLHVDSLECHTCGAPGTGLESPLALLVFARSHRQTAALDLAGAAAALSAALALPCRPRLFLKVHAATLLECPDLPARLVRAASAVGEPIHDLTVEVVGNLPVCGGLDRAIARLRRSGFGIAVEDLEPGARSSGLLVDCRPDYFKLGRHLIDSCDTDPYRRAVLSSVQSLAKATGARAIAAGVETLAELNTVTSLGIELLQGTLISPAVPGHELVDRGLLPTGIKTGDRTNRAAACAGLEKRGEECPQPETHARASTAPSRLRR